MAQDTRSAAPRHQVTALAFLLTLVGAAPVDAVDLFLSRAEVATLDVEPPPASEAQPAPRVERSRATGRRAPLPAFIPQRLLIPDLYSEEIGLRLPVWAAPVDGDRVVGFDLLGRPRRGWMATLAYDEESRGPLPGDADVIRLIGEIRF